MAHDRTFAEIMQSAPRANPRGAVNEQERMMTKATWWAAACAAGLLATGCGGGMDPEPADTAAEMETEAADASGAGTIQRLDPRLDALVPPDAVIEKVAEGYVFTEGPVWDRISGTLFFSDVRGNAVYQWSEADGPGTLLEPVFDGDREGLALISTNGLTLDENNRLVMCEHGNRRISRLEADGSRSVVVDRYEGRRLNSPNDLVYGPDGSLYFTDPPYGMEGQEESPLRELDFNGVFRLRPDGELELLVNDMSRPNGIALSPDGATLYVANSDSSRRVWMAYDVDESGASNGRVLRDVTGDAAPGNPDGLKVDQTGHLFATGPGGVLVMTPEGEHIGTIAPAERPANVAWGGDGNVLYMTANTGVYRVTLSTNGKLSGPFRPY